MGLNYFIQSRFKLSDRYKFPILISVTLIVDV